MMQFPVPPARLARMSPVQFGAMLACSDAVRASAFPPVDSFILRAAIRALLSSAPETGLYTSIERPVWNGWVTPAMVAFHLPEHLRDAPFQDALPHAAASAYQSVAEVMMDMQCDGWLERRICHPWRGHTSPDVASLQDWEYRLAGDAGYCHWEPSAPVSEETRQGWKSLVNERHLAALLESLGDSDVPPYILSRIERYRGHKTRRRVMLR